MADRRAFLRGLAALPLIGGSVAILGQPTQAAVPVTVDLLRDYADWLDMERWRTLSGLYGTELAQDLERHRRVYGEIWDWHRADKAGPSSRAAVILSAAGVPLERL